MLEGNARLKQPLSTSFLSLGPVFLALLSSWPPPSLVEEMTKDAKCRDFQGMRKKLVVRAVRNNLLLVKDEENLSQEQSQFSRASDIFVFTTDMSYDALLALDDCYVQTWIIDSGASFHVTPHREWFASYLPMHGLVKLGDSHQLEILGIGDVKICMANGTQFLLKDVRHVPKLSKSLVSTRQLDELGYTTVFGNGSWLIRKANLPGLDYVLVTDYGEPSCYKEAIQMEDSVKWEQAMQSEYNSIIANETWKLTKFPQRKQALPCKWVYKKKYTTEDPEPKYKARLVAKCFKQKKAVDFDEILSPVVKMTTLGLVLGLVATEDLELNQMDVKLAFLHGDLEEDVYMVQPEGFEMESEKPKRVKLVCRLCKALYGLKQGSRQ
ncbi:hypothetical protein L7F22_064084 [Adiantum nelumboides]|nr:hypothetical protein [Adiantum nelumboides]